MVEESYGANESYPKIGDKLELKHFYEWNNYTEEEPECDEEKAQENADIVEGELESLASILTEQEYE